MKLVAVVAIFIAFFHVSSDAVALKTQMLRIPSASGMKAENPALKKLCEKTDYPALCVSSVSPFLLSDRNDPMSLLGVAIKAASHNAAVAMAAFKRLKPADSDIAAGLEQCKESYADAVDNLKSASKAVSRRDQGTANSMLSAVVTDTGDCEDSFQVEGKSPVFEYNDRLRKMASNCLAIVSVVKW